MENINEQEQLEQEYLTQTPNIQWFPGHMAKTRRVMKESLKLVDIVVELRDARIPKSSRNPEIEKIVGDKPRLVVFNKADIADPAVTKEWQEYYKSHGVRTLALDCRSGKGLKELVPAVRQELHDLLEKRKARGMESRPIRMMIVGVPNVGKSSLINRLAGRQAGQGGGPPGRYPRQTVGAAGKRHRTARYAGCALAEIRRPPGRRASGLHRRHQGRCL